MARKGLLIDLAFCCGCHTCEVACQKEHGFSVGQWGIHVHEEGPWQIEGTKRTQFDFIPAPTDLCDLCEDRTAKGQLPTCVKHCQTGAMHYGTVEELSEQLESLGKPVLYMR